MRDCKFSPDSAELMASLCAYLVLKDRSIFEKSIAGTALQNQLRLQSKTCSPSFAAKRPAGL
jgi:hypothetical protein